MTKEVISGNGVGSSENQAGKLSRRMLLKGAIAAAAYSAVSVAGAHEFKPEVIKPLAKHSTNEQVKETQRHQDTDRPAETPRIARTILESEMFTFAEVYATSLLPKKVLSRMGNAGLNNFINRAKEQHEKKPHIDLDRTTTRRAILGGLIILADMAVAGPLREEFVFRNIPSYLLKDNKTVRWDVGIASSIAFAYIHNFIRKDNKLKFDLKTIPVHQFIGGLFFWNIMRKRGYKHAVAAHSTMNITAVPNALAVIGLKEAGKAVYRKFTKAGKEK